MSYKNPAMEKEPKAADSVKQITDPVPVLQFPAEYMQTACTTNEPQVKIFRT